ncbi:helix-turn-helix domain-containing protein [Oceanospirillum beijerinckii]|uniref:helix-turn-helix domain-containing protein n=1 Tax=Oceanospirillum beijerinckii TaxID=64976 RepID=UPI0004246D86|nr:helix-turn-helix domain-containing protein [Oceanospirillum beijerinckii]
MNKKLRNWAIYQAFNGNNLEEVAQAFDVSRDKVTWVASQPAPKKPKNFSEQDATQVTQAIFDAKAPANKQPESLQIMDALKGHVLSGLALDDLTRQLDMAPSTVIHYLTMLTGAGMVTQLEDGNYALSVRTLQIAQAYSNEMIKASNRINTLSQQVVAGRF